jgi:hypothetical protein
MRSIELVFDNSKKLFSIPVMLIKRAPPSFGIPAKAPPHVNAIMYIDTGSNLTSVTDNEAKRLEISNDNLTSEDVGGVGGMSKIPISNQISIFVMDKNNSTLEIKLERIGVNPEKMIKKVEKNRGTYKERGTSTAQMICLFGLDAIEKIRGKLEIDMVSKTGEIQCNS